MSMISGWVISGVWRVTLSLRARIRFASLPVRPRAWPPWRLIRLTMSLFTWPPSRSEEHTSELQSRENLVCRLLLEKKNHLTQPAAVNADLAAHGASTQ